MFIQLRLESEVRQGTTSLTQDEELQSIEDLTTMNEENASKKAGSCMLHIGAEQLKDMVAYFLMHIYHWPPEEEWNGWNSVVTKIWKILQLKGFAKKKLVLAVICDVAERM